MTERLKDYSFGVVPARAENSRILYLLVQHRGGHWSFPKGHAEPGETPLATARRELSEETGIREADIRDHETFVERYDTIKRGKDVDKTVTYFLGWIAGPAVRIQPEEISAFAWLPYAEALSRITYEETRRILRDAARAAGDTAAEWPI